VKVVIEQFKRLEQVLDGTVFPEKRVTGCIECQRDDEIPQSNIQPVLLVCSFLEALISKNDVLVDSWLHVYWGEKIVCHWEKGFLHHWGVCEPVNQDTCASTAEKIWKFREATDLSLIPKATTPIFSRI